MRWTSRLVRSAATFAVAFLGLPAAAATVSAAGPQAPTLLAPNTLTFSSGSVTFPDVYVGGQAYIEITLRNDGATDANVYPEPSLSSTTNFQVSPHCGGLAPGLSCRIELTYRPTTEGVHTATLRVDDDLSGQVYTLNIRGTSPSPITVSSTSLDFGTVVLGDHAEGNVTVRNAGATAVPISGDVSDSTHFSLFGCGVAEVPASGAATCRFVFDPVALGETSTIGYLNVGGKTFSVDLKGRAVDAADLTATSTSVATTMIDAGVSTEPPAGGSAAVVPGPIVSGDGVVIAQGVVEFPDGTFGWQHEPFDASAWPLTVDDRGPSLLVSFGGSPVLVTSGSTSVALLDENEATFLPIGVPATVQPLDEAGISDGFRLTFAGSADTGSFSPGVGARDVNLIGAVLHSGDTLSIASEFSLFAVAVDGTVTAGTDELAAGAATVLDSAVEFTNSGETPVRLFVAAVGGQVP